jgi:crotonobetainyl-CoA:carnitine CoA-transferase CaiB-like acyl-CoA transferase
MTTGSRNLVPEPFGPLEGVRILSTGTLIAQPFAAHLAGAFGAEVIQVEHPSGTCDPWRRLDPPVRSEDGTVAVASSFVQERRNAHYITLDLSTPDGRELFLRLVRSRDIWMESSKPGTFPKWGLSDDVVLAANPALVITHVSGYGQSGHPDYLGRASYDMVGQAFGGLMFQTGFPDPDPPTRAAPYTGDYITALFALWSTLAAYIHRQRTGEGQVVDLAQFEAVHQILAGTMVEYYGTGSVRARSGNRAPHFQPYDVFAASDGWVVMGAAGPIFTRTCELIGLDPDKYASAATELTSAEGVEFDLRLREWIAARTVTEVVDQLNAVSVPSCPVMSSAAMADDPHYEARGVHIEWDDLQVGRVKGTGVAPRFSRTPGRIWRGSVPVGHDNELIYRDLLGLSAGDLADLRQRGVI